MDIKKEALKLHETSRGKLEIKSKVPLKNKLDLSLAYTPGVAEPCIEIHKNRELVYKYTFKSNMVAVVSDGSAVLGLGNIGAEAALPVMEGKCLLFKAFGDVDAFPICVSTQKSDEIVDIVKKISPVFGGINLEDISAPRCFEVEERLKKELDIPVFHDDQHGTAVVVLAGLINALKVTGKKKEDISVVMNGAGAAGIAVTKMLLDFGIKDITIVDTIGAIYNGRKENMNFAKEEMAKLTNKRMERGKLGDVITGKDVFIGVSSPNILTRDMVEKMNKPIIFAMANPIPEINPEEAKKGGAVVIATGRSDYPNQINNVLAFPNIFRGALDVRAKDINSEMKLAAALALAEIVKNPTPEKIIPDPFDPEIKKVAKAVAEAAIKSGVARVKP